MGKALGEFVTVRYAEDNRHAKSVIRKFNVQAVPTLLVLGTDGAELEYPRGFLYREAAKAEWLKRGEEAGDEPQMLNMVAWECFLAGWHTEKATGWARKAVKLSGRDPAILDTLASLLFKQGRVDEAIRLEEEALEKIKDPAMRIDFEENLAKWNAVKILRAERAKKAGN